MGFQNTWRPGIATSGVKASGGTGGSYQSKAPAQPSAFDYSGEQFPEDIPF